MKKRNKMGIVDKVKDLPRQGKNKITKARTWMAGRDNYRIRLTGDTSSLLEGSLEDCSSECKLLGEPLPHIDCRALSYNCSIQK